MAQKLIKLLFNAGYFLFLLLNLEGLFAQSNLNKIDNFPNADKFKIAFLRQGNVWIMNENGKDQTQLTFSGNVISLTTSENYIFFGDKVGEDLDVKCINTKKLEEIFKLACLKGGASFPGYEPLIGQTMFFSDNKNLSVVTNFDAIGASGIYRIDIVTHVVELISEFSKIPIREKCLVNTTSDKGKYFFSKKINKEYELFYVNKAKNVIKISSTQSFTPRLCWEENVVDFNYSNIFNNKILFGFTTECGDYGGYQILHIANLDGTYQQFISGLSVSDATDFLKSNGEFVILIDGKIMTYLGKKNEPYVIADNIQYFELITNQD